MTSHSTTIRFLSIDLLKLLAIFLMIENHVIFYLLDPQLTPPPLSSYISSIYSLTILSSALFLFLTGFNLYLSHLRSALPPSLWLKTKLRQALILIILSQLLHLLGNDPLTTPLSSGILQTIASLWIIFSPSLLLLPSSLLLTLSLTLPPSLLLIQQSLISLHLFIPFINSHSFPLIPYAIFFILGLLAAQITLPNRQLHTISRSNLLLLIGLWLISSLHLATHSSLWDILSDRFIITNHYQPTFLLTLYLSGLLFTITAITTKFELFLRRSPLIIYLAKAGQYALDIYVLHLLIILLLTHTLFPHQTTLTFALIIFILITILAVPYSHIRYHLSRRQIHS